MRKAPGATFGTPKSLQIKCLDHSIVIRSIIANNGANLVRKVNMYLVKTVGIGDAYLLFNPKRFYQCFKLTGKVLTSMASGHSTHGCKLGLTTNEKLKINVLHKIEHKTADISFFKVSDCNTKERKYVWRCPPIECKVESVSNGLEMGGNGET